MLNINNLKIFIVFTIAAFFTLIVFNNITDYDTNYFSVQSVLSMDSIKATEVLGRAIKTPWIITSVYILLILTEASIAILCSLSVILSLLNKNGKPFAILGLTIAFGLFMLGFVVIGGEWFYMWLHPTLGGLQQKAAVLALVMLCTLIFITEKPHN